MFNDTAGRTYGEGEDTNDKVLAEGILELICDHVAAGTITVAVIGGTVAAGVFAGAGSGAWSGDPASTSSTLVTAWEGAATLTTGNNAVIGSALSTAVIGMISAGQVECDISGTTTPPQPAPPITVADATATGTMIVTSPFVQAWDVLPVAENNSTIADQIAAWVDLACTAATIVVAGQGDIAGSVGSGVWAPPPPEPEEPEDG